MVSLLRRRAMMVQAASGGLPPGYIQVEYIANVIGEETQIDTGIVPANTCTVIDYKFDEYNSPAFLAVGKDESGQRYRVLYKQSTAYLAWYLHSSTARSAQQAINKNRHTIIYNNEGGQVIYDNTVKATNSGFDCTGGNTTVKVFTPNAALRIYGMTMTDNSNGTLLRNFIPCYKTADGEAGLYDTVSGNFFGNINGTGTIVYG